MKTAWEDRDIERALRSMQGAAPPDRGWGDRVWAGIEGRLHQDVSPWAAFFRPAAVRWAVAAACLLLAVGVTVQQRKAREVDLGGYLAHLYMQRSVEEDEVEIREPILLTDGTGLIAVDEEGEGDDPSVYDTMLEL